MKKTLILALTLLLALYLSCVPALAAGADAVGAAERAGDNLDPEYAAAQRLYELGLFMGRGTLADGRPDFDLDSPATREEAVVMLLRLMGRADTAGRANYDCPFGDVSEWARPYVGYAYSFGLVQGVSETGFDAGRHITASEYLTLVLRALGYSSEEDFNWEKAWLKSDEIGLTHGEYPAQHEFDRGDTALISAAALETNTKWSGRPLFDYLNQSGFDGGEIARMLDASYRPDGVKSVSVPALRLAVTENGGMSDCFVHMDDLWQLLAAASGLDMSLLDAPFTESDIQPRQEHEFTPIEKNYGPFSVRAYYRAAGMNFSEFAAEYSAGGQSVSFAAGRTFEPGRMYFNGDIRFCAVSPRFGGNLLYVSANDFLAYFGFDLACSVSESGGDAAWELVRRGGGKDGADDALAAICKGGLTIDGRQVLTGEADPFILDGTVYLPLCAAVEAEGRLAELRAEAGVVLIKKPDEIIFPKSAGLPELTVPPKSAAAGETVEEKSVKIQSREVRVQSDGVYLNPYGGTVSMLTVDGTDYLPMETLAEALQMDAAADSAAGTVTLSPRRLSRVVCGYEYPSHPQDNRLVEQTVFTYDAAGSIISRVRTDAGGGILESDTYEYDALGRRTRHRHIQANTDLDNLYAYDDAGRVSEHTLRADCQGKDVPNGTYVTRFTYGEQGLCVREEDLRGDDESTLKTWRVTQYGYDAAGNMVSRKKTDWPGGEDEYAEIDVWSYDAQERVIEHQSYYEDLRCGKSIERYTYDRYGNLIRGEYISDGETSVVYDYTWSADGHMLSEREEQIFNGGDIENSVYTTYYTYDETTGWETGEVNVSSYDGVARTDYIQKFDGHGRLTEFKAVFTDSNGPNWSASYYAYDAAGRMIRYETDGDGYRYVQIFEYAEAAE